MFTGRSFNTWVPNNLERARNSKEEFRAANPQDVPTQAPTTPKPPDPATPVHHFKKPAVSTPVHHAQKPESWYGFSKNVFYVPAKFVDGTLWADLRCAPFMSRPFPSTGVFTQPRDPVLPQVVGSCARFGCGPYKAEQSCQCDAECRNHGSSPCTGQLRLLVGFNCWW